VIDAYPQNKTVPLIVAPWTNVHANAIKIDLINYDNEK